MSEVFSGTPAIVSVTIADQEGKQVQFHVAGQELDSVAVAIQAALAALPSEGSSDKPKKTRKQRRTKAEMAAASVVNPEPEINHAPRNKKERLATADAGKTWP